MSIDRSFIEKIEEMAKAEKFTLDGIDYFTKALVPVKPPCAAKFTAHSLQAVADYINNLSGETNSIVVHVSGPELVSVFSRLDSVHRIREYYLESTLLIDEFAFGKWHGLEEFVIAMQAQFVQDETTADILKIVGNVTAEAGITVEDDGITQRATAKTGLVKRENVNLPNPVLLQPFRSFPEIEPAPTKFVFRMKGGLDHGFHCSLHEADGGAWKVETMRRIRDWLRANLPDNTDIIA